MRLSRPAGLPWRQPNVRNQLFIVHKEDQDIMSKGLQDVRDRRELEFELS